MPNWTVFYIQYSEDLVTQILEELGLQLQHQLPELPGQSKARGPQKVAADGSVTTTNNIEDDLQARLDNLRRD